MAPPLARFHREVRVARQVSPQKTSAGFTNIGDVDGRHFSLEEFIKGEELSSFMRRIGASAGKTKAMQLGPSDLAPDSPPPTMSVCCIGI